MHNLGQFLEGYLDALPEMAYRIILAEKAAEVAVAQKDSAGAEPADQGFLFTEMRPVA